MKLKQFLLEYTVPDFDAESISNFLQSNCDEFMRSPLLAQYRKSDFLYRGMKSKSPMLLKYTHPNRRPKDMPDGVHDQLDKWMLKKFGHRYRSNATFCTTDRTGTAESYGDPYIIVPVGPFDFITSEYVTDAYEDLYETPGKRLVGKLNKNVKITLVVNIMKLLCAGISDKKIQAIIDEFYTSDLFDYFLKVLIFYLIENPIEILRSVKMSVKIGKKELEVVERNLVNSLVQEKIFGLIVDAVEYVENDYKLLKLGNEVMIKCKAYLAVSHDFRNLMKDA